MSSLTRNRKSKIIRLRIGVGVFAVVLFVVMTFIIPMPSFLTKTGLFIASPVLRVGNAIGDMSVNALELLNTKYALVAENRRLTNELEQVSVRLLDRNLLKEENLALKESFGRFSYEKVIYAPVLIKPNRSPYDVLILDGGYSDGIAVKNYVLSSESVVIGEIVEVGKRTSRARLFSTDRTVTPVVISSLNIQVDAVGRGNGNYEIKIPRDLDVVEGDEIIAPGLSPKLFGVVEDILVSPTDSQKTLIFKSPINIAELSAVFIVTEDEIKSE